MNIYTERTHCMFCEHHELKPLWDICFEIPLGCYVIPDKNKTCYSMPFNIVKCQQCLSYQTQYLGNLDIIYDYNANSHGTIRSTMDQLFASFILSNTSITKIMEIGGGNGGLSDIILEKNPTLEYTIVDPTYSGNTNGKIIQHTFFENIPNTDIHIDTIVMSHVFEHFYEPAKIIQRFKDISNIKHIFLNLPDLESYINHDNYHVLNPEHIFYVENQFIIQLFKKYGFIMKQIYYHEKHSVFFEFERSQKFIQNDSIHLFNSTSEIDVPNFFKRIFDKIHHIYHTIEAYPERPVYIWPCSMHTIYLFALGLNPEKITAILDNAPHKIGQYLYGYKKKCIPFNDILNSNQDCIVILNGGCYNQEIKNKGYPHILFI